MTQIRDTRWAAALELALFLGLFLLLGWLFPGPVVVVGIPFPIRTAVKLVFCTGALWLRGSGWRAVGLGRPTHWRPTVLVGIGTGLAWQAISSLVVNPLISHWLGRENDLSAFANLANGNLGALALWLVITWTFAAFGEELVYRAYLITRLTDLVGTTRLGWLVSWVLASAVFGLSHAYQGLSGVISTMLAGLVFGGLYLARQRNLWAPILAHGALDTAGFILLYALLQ